MVLMAGVMPLLTAGCSDQDGQELLPDGPALQLHLAAGTRSDGDDQSELSSVHVFLTRTSATPEYTEGDFFRSGNAWTSTANVSTAQYFIYGYAPTDIGTCTIDHLDGQSTYESGAKLTFTDLDPVSDSDVGVVIGVLGKTTSEAASTVTYNEITTGSFSYAGQPEGSNFVCLKLNHLYAAVKFQAKVSTEYDLLRTIKIRKMELQSDYAKPTATINLSSGSATGISGDIVWSGFTAGSGITTKKTIFEAEGTEESPYTTLTTEAQPVGTGYLIEKQRVTLVTTYDILDKAGNIVRSNCTAANKIDLSTLEAGEKLTRTLTVDPSYLYQLSEPDPDSPKIKIS